MYSFTPTRALANITATMSQLIETSFVGPMHNRIMAAAPWWVRGLRDLAGFVGGFVVGELISGGNPVVGVAAGAATAAGCSAKD